MPSINQFLKQLTTGDNLKDFAHASKIFIDDNYRLSPKYGFLFHVAIDVNPEISRMPRDQLLELGMIVKSAALPKFTVDSKTLNAYNRANIVQNKIKYDPVSIVFHDDSADVVRNFWYDYYSYYYRDSDYQDGVYGYSSRYQRRQDQAWGYTPRSQPGDAWSHQFIKSVRIYSLHQKRFSEYTLVNPTITAFRHGDHVNGENGSLMTHEMNIAYETVKYRYGAVTVDNVTGFADLHYDHTPSPLTPAGGGTKSILGPGGLLNTTDEVMGDLAEGNYGAAIFKASRGLQNFKGANLGKMAKSELTNIGMEILKGNNPLRNVNVPSIGGIVDKIKSVSNPNLGGNTGGAARSNGDVIDYT